MTASTVETAGKSGGDADGLRGSPMNASAGAALGKIMARKRPDCLADEHRECLLISRSTIESSRMPMAVVGRKLSGKSRMMRESVSARA